MKSVLADAFFYLALLNVEDRHHAEAADLARQLGYRYVTSDYVLVEVGDALCGARMRARSAASLGASWRHPRTQVVPASQDILDRATRLYASRPDKAWSLTDCTSFVIMEDHKLTECLTADRHFVQAGFSVLFPVE